MSVKVLILNAPGDLEKRDGFIVARVVDGKFWYYGIYESYTRAMNVAKEIGNGVVFEVGDPEEEEEEEGEEG